jgi:MFS family permease
MTTLVTLLTAASILLLSTGLQSTLISVRAEMEGMSPTMIGALGSIYFAGYLAGAFMAPRLIGQVGHIRVFAALAAIAASSAIALVLFVDPYAWLIMRCVMGFCASGMFTVLESWLNGVSNNANRGKVFSAYGMVDIASVTAAQFLLPVLGPGGFTGFAVMAMLLSMALVPIALSPATQPVAEEAGTLRIWEVWQISPLAFVACLGIGLTYSAFRTIGPLYAHGIGLDFGQLALFMGAGIGGGAFLQLPIGWLSDHFDRRYVLMAATLGASLASLMLSLMPGTSPPVIYAGVFLFGAFAMPLYSLAAAHAADFAKPQQYASLAAGMLFTFAVGSMIGPLIAASAVEAFGPPALFRYICVVHAGIVLWTIVRMTVRPTVPAADRVRHVPVLRTNPARAQRGESDG